MHAYIQQYYDIAILSVITLGRRYLASHGVRHIELLGRTGHLGSNAASEHLVGLLTGRWSAAITISKCDTSCAEDMRAAMVQQAKAGAASIVLLFELFRSVPQLHKRTAGTEID